MNLPPSPYYTERVHRNYRDCLTFVWLMTRKCNFKCIHCYGPDNDLTPFDLDKFIEKLNEFEKPFRVQITGGEPLLFPWMIECIQKIGKIGGKVELQTNFSLQVRELLDNTDPSYLEFILASYHPVERERVISGGVKKFIDDFLYARNKGFTIMTWYIDDPRIGVDAFLANCKMLYDAGIVPVRKRYTGPENGGEPGDAIVCPGLLCRAGYRYFVIWENFDITPCDHDRTPLGNLFTGYKLLDTFQPCPKPFCGCGAREILYDCYRDSFFNKEFGGY